MTHLFKIQRHIGGRSIVELMIAIVISMVILIVLISLFVANKQTFRATDDKSRLDEEGRLALNLIAFHLRMAGYGALTTTQIPPRGGVFTDFSNTFEAVNGCSNGFADNTSTANTCAVGTASSSIAIRQVIDQYDANLTAGALPTDCLGNGVGITPAIVENRFFVATNAVTAIPELYCVGSGGTAVGAANFANGAQPIAENVVSMNITYGYSSSSSQSVDGYYTAAQIIALAAPATGTNWGRIVSAQICLVVRSANNGLTTSAQQYRDCTGAVVTATDRRLYSTFSTFVTIRNRASGSTL